VEAAAKLGVSDNGDHLSPKKQPETIAPAAIGKGMPNPVAIPPRAKPKEVSIPQLLPVTIAATAVITKAENRNIAGLIIPKPR